MVHRLSEISHIKSSEKKEVILEYLADCEDKEVIAMKRTLSQNVPYRLQAPFMESMKGKEWNRSGKNLAARINQEHRLIYYFLQFRGMSTQIQIQKEWADYIKQNYEIIEGWIELNLIQYLQRRESQCSGNCGQAISAEREKSGKGKKILENDCCHKNCMRNLWGKPTE